MVYIYNGAHRRCLWPPLKLSRKRFQKCDHVLFGSSLADLDALSAISCCPKNRHNSSSFLLIATKRVVAMRKRHDSYSFAAVSPNSTSTTILSSVAVSSIRRNIKDAINDVTIYIDWKLKEKKHQRRTLWRYQVYWLKKEKMFFNLHKN